MVENGPLWRANLRLGSGLILLTFVVCHLTAHATLLISIGFGESMLRQIMAPWRTAPGTVLLIAAFTVHYLNALWSIYARRTLRLARWELWQLGLGLSIPLLLMSHVISTRIAEEILKTTPYYNSMLVILWIVAPWLAILQAATLIIVWSHACIGIYFWLRTKPWFPKALIFLRPVALLLPALALAGFVSAGNQILSLADDDSNFALFSLNDSNYTDQTRTFIWQISLAAIGGHICLVLIPFMGRRIRAEFYRRRRPPILTYPGGRRCIVMPGSSVLEILRDNGIPHAAVCGGRARCTTCRVLVTEGLVVLPPPSDLEARALARIGASPGMRLACQIRPTSDISIVPLLSPNASALDGMARGGLEGRERLITVLFVDLRGSTTFGESRMPYDVLFILNVFFQEMTKALEATNGHYSQFTGDGLMAIYGLDGDVNQGAADALRGAADMLKRLEALNLQMASEIRTPLRIGIGIHFSEAIVGSMGPPNSQIVTAIGDTVNTCARLESLTKDYDCSLIISRRAAEAARLNVGECQLHEAEVKGRVAAVQFYVLKDIPAVTHMLQATEQQGEQA